MHEFEFFFSRRRCLLVVPQDHTQFRPFLSMCGELLHISKRSTRPPQIELALCVEDSSAKSELRSLFSKTGLTVLSEIPEDLSPYHLVCICATDDSRFVANKCTRDHSMLFTLDLQYFQTNPFAASCAWLRNFLLPSLYLQLQPSALGAPISSYLVTAIVSIYKGERYLRHRLDNLLAQTLGDRLEILVIDAHSPENEQGIIEPYLRKHRNITYLRLDEREGIYASWSRGCKMAQGTYLTNANADDVLRPDALEILAQELDQHPQAGLAYGDYWVTNRDNQNFPEQIRIGYAYRPDYAPNIMRSGCYMGPQPMWRKSLHTEIGYFDASYVAAGDYEFWCRIAAAGHSMRHVPQFLGIYQHNVVGIINSNLNIAVTETLKVQALYQNRLPAPQPMPQFDFYPSDNTPPLDRHCLILIDAVGSFFSIQTSLELLWKNSHYPYRIGVLDPGDNCDVTLFLQEAVRCGKIQFLHTSTIPDAELGSLDSSAEFIVRVQPVLQKLSPIWLELIVGILHHDARIEQLSWQADSTSPQHQVIATIPLSDPIRVLRAHHVPAAPLFLRICEPGFVSRLNSAAFVNIGMICYNRLEFTKQSLESVLAMTHYPYTLTIIDNASTDGTREYLQVMHAKGHIKNLVLLNENEGVARASNIAWHMEPAAAYYMKLDNDIVVQKSTWLEDMVHVLSSVPTIGMLGYNLEATSYPLCEKNGVRYRVKPQGNLGGATVLVPRRTQEFLGFWSEEFGLYGEEDADYGWKVKLLGLENAYMEDEDALFHLPAGKAAVIHQKTFEAKDGLEEVQDRVYREWKDEQRRQNLRNDGLFHRNLVGYNQGWMPFSKPGTLGFLATHSNTLGPVQSQQVPDQLTNSRVHVTSFSWDLLFVMPDPSPHWWTALARSIEHAGTSPTTIVIAVPLDFADPELTKLANLDHIRIIRTPSPCSRAYMIAQAAKCLRSPWTALLAPNLVPAPGWARDMHAFAWSMGLSVLGGCVLRDAVTIDHAGYVYDARTQALCSAFQGGGIGNAELLGSDIIPSPWFLLLKTECLQQIDSDFLAQPHGAEMLHLLLTLRSQRVLTGIFRVPARVVMHEPPPLLASQGISFTAAQMDFMPAKKPLSALTQSWCTECDVAGHLLQGNARLFQQNLA